MTYVRPTLHLLCGKIAAGKSTLCAELASDGAIVIAQDHWMSVLYKEELRTVADYLRLVPRLRDALGPHVIELLCIGVSVVLDWPANTIESREWMRGLFERAGAFHQLHYIDVSDKECLARLQRRNTSGRHEYQVSQAEFEELSRYFQPPTTDEMFNLVVHRTQSSP